MKFPRSQARDVTSAMKLVPTAVLGDGHVSEGHGLRQEQKPVWNRCHTPIIRPSPQSSNFKIHQSNHPPTTPNWDFGLRTRPDSAGSLAVGRTGRTGHNGISLHTSGNIRAILDSLALQKRGMAV